MLDFALQIALHSATVEAADLELLHAPGASVMRDIWDIGAIAAFFAMRQPVGQPGCDSGPMPKFYSMGPLVN